MCVCVCVCVCVCLCTHMHTQDVRLWVSLCPRWKGGILTFAKRASLGQLRELEFCSTEWEKWVQGSERFQFSSVPKSLWPHGLWHARLSCPLPCPGVCSNSCPLSQWCHPTISSSAISLSSCPQSFPASGSFQRVSSSHQVAKVLELRHQFFQWIFQVDFL